ncbi:stealth conserved region 3 domain-containing protein [Sulfitobacter sp. HNIBRBA3233]|uniref:stealth conserved region 3 domain-containing protein n=1 Tax=Sulfitobacter marinivivus TaxID=3158558 RepID=UPI0032E02036
MEKIDAVIMWVDGEDPIFVRQHANYSGIVAKAARKHEVRARHRNNGELNYCLRGIHDNMPWINRIHIVTSGQVPDGIDFDNPRLNLVIHSDIFPDLSVLPTFNSFAIDSCLHHIPGLSDKFIRFSDDFLAINPVEPKMLMGVEGQGKYYFGHGAPDMNLAGDVKGNYRRTLGFNRFVLGTRGIVAAHAPLHVPQMRKTEICERIEKNFAKDLAITRDAKFRTDRDLSMLFFYPHYVAKLLEAPLDEENHHQGPAFSYATWGVARQALVGDAKQDWRKTMQKAKDEKAVFLNVNDHLGNEPDPQDMIDFETLLDQVLPNPAPWEQS